MKNHFYFRYKWLFRTLLLVGSWSNFLLLWYSVVVFLGSRLFFELTSDSVETLRFLFDRKALVWRCDLLGITWVLFWQRKKMEKFQEQPEDDQDQVFEVEEPEPRYNRFQIDKYYLVLQFVFNLDLWSLNLDICGSLHIFSFSSHWYNYCKLL